MANKRSTQTSILRDIRQRHSNLHDLSDACGRSLSELIPALPIAAEHGLSAELDAVHDALTALHEKARAKWEAL